MKLFRITVITAITLIFTVSCVSIEDMAMNAAADLLTSDSGAADIFTADNDPQLIADALPLALKLYEAVLASKPENADLQYATGRNFIMYSNAFIQTPAGMLPDEEYLEQKKMLFRSKKMYFRGRDYVLNGIELKYPGFAAYIEEEDIDNALALVDMPGDAGMLYWAASGWIAAYSCDPLDFELAHKLYIPAAMLLRALELDETYSNGAIHDIFIQIYSSLPSSHIINAVKKTPETAGKFEETYYTGMGISNKADERTDFHFRRAIELAEGNNPGTYCSYAASVCVKKQDYRRYRDLLEKALLIDPALVPENELVITIYQEKAAWMLEHAEEFFIIIEE